MLVGIIKNQDKTYEYLFKNIHNALIACHVSKEGIEKSNEQYINELLSKFKYNNNCEYLTEFKGYTVYYDPETNLKHFLYNGTENYEMLFKYNGENAVLYNKGFTDWFTKYFIILGLTAVVTVSSFTFLINTKYDMNANFSVYSSHDLSKLKNLYDYEPIDIETAINYINESNTPDTFKEVASDERLLNLVFSYYKGSALEYTARLKFEDLKKLPMDESYVKGTPINGYYDVVNPNEIRADSDDIRLLLHEYIHLLQAEGSPYMYINEAVAELMACELLDTPITTYHGAVDNLKLLINIIGPEPIYELTFGGDDTKLNQILSDNLSNKDVMTLKYYFRKTGLEIMSETNMHIEIKNILCKLYKNIYGHDIKENKDIMQILTDDEVDLGKDAITVDKRKYLIPFVMEDREFVRVVVPDYEKLAENNLFTKKVEYIEYIKIENPSYKMFFNSTGILWKETYNNDEYIYGKIINDGVRPYYKHLDNPIRKEDYGLNNFEGLPSSDFSIVEAIEKGYIEAYEQKISSEKTKDSEEEHITYIPNNSDTIMDSSSCEFFVDSIKVRFKEQYDNLISRMNNNNYHK